MGVQSSAEGLSPSTICTRIERWSCLAVLNCRLALTGRGVLRGMTMPLRRRLVCGSTPTTPRLCELTLRMLKVAARPSRLARIKPACRAAPWATASSAATEASGALPLIFCNIARTIGMRVEPPTSSTRSRSDHSRPAARRACTQVKRVRSRRSCVASSNCSREISTRSDLALIFGDDGRLGPGGKRPLGVFAFPPELARGGGVGAEVEPMFALEGVGGQVQQPLVPVVAAQGHVAVGGQGQELAAADLHHGDVERAAAQVVDQHPPRLVGAAGGVEKTLLEAEGHGRRGRLVDDVQHFAAGHVAGVLRGLAADLVEIGRHRDHRLVERPDLLHGVAAELVEDPGLDHLGRILLAVDRAMIGAMAHVALGALGHAIGLAAHGLHGLLAHDHVVAVQQHDAGREAIALGIDQGHGLSALVEPCDHGVRGAQVDAHGWNVCFGHGAGSEPASVHRLLLLAALPPKSRGKRSGRTCEIIR